jgi:hypothetical protein
MSKERTVKGEKGTYILWSKKYEPENGGIDVYHTVNFFAKLQETDEIVKEESIRFGDNFQNSSIDSQLDRLEKEAKNDFKMS